MNIKYIDIHSHLNLKEFDADIDQVVQRMTDGGIATITVGCDVETSQKAVDLSAKYENLYACVGIHPTDNQTEIFDQELMLGLAQNEKVVAIGECGYDYYRGADEKEKQRQKVLFIKHIELALQINKPLMIHARPTRGSMDAYTDALDLLERYKKDNPTLQANLHFFVGDIGIARRALDLGFTMSFDGPVTFSRDYDAVIAMLPIESIMAETDAPFAAPAPHRGKRCDPAMVIEVVKKIAEIKNLSIEDARIAILENSKRVFDIKV